MLAQTSIDQRFAQIDQRCAQIDQRLAQVDERFDRVDQRFDEIIRELAFADVHSAIERLSQRLGDFIESQSAINQSDDRRLTALEARSQPPRM